MKHNYAVYDKAADTLENLLSEDKFKGHYEAAIYCIVQGYRRAVAELTDLHSKPKKR